LHQQVIQYTPISDQKAQKCKIIALINSALQKSKKYFWVYQWCSIANRIHAFCPFAATTQQRIGMATTPSLSSDYASLLEAVRLVVRQELKGYSVQGQRLPAPPPPGQPEADEALNSRQVATLLDISQPHVYTMMHRGELPTHKRAGRYFWKKSEVMALLQKQDFPQTEPAPRPARLIQPR
jgi:predicted DNA-binding transcriptional regulator AlpA